MTTKFKVDEKVLVPAARLSNADDAPFGLVERKVLETADRSIVVDDCDGDTVRIASRLVHPASLGFLVLRIGDLRRDGQLLDPLAKSILQFLRLLLPDERVRQVSIRTIDELKLDWRLYEADTSHVIVVGHGTPTGILFLEENVLAADLARALTELDVGQPKTWISLACQTGRTDFARPFSQSAVCRELIAPLKSVHGAAASRFCQNFLSEFLLDGYEGIAAYNRADQHSGRKFLRWRNGLCHRSPEL